MYILYSVYIERKSIYIYVYIYIMNVIVIKMSQSFSFKEKKKQKRQAEALFTLIFRSLTIFFGIVKPA